MPLAKFTETRERKTKRRLFCRCKLHHEQAGATIDAGVNTGGEVAFEDMTQPQLKDELAARGEARSGLKYVLQRPLGCSTCAAALLVQAAKSHRGAAGGRRDR